MSCHGDNGYKNIIASLPVTQIDRRIVFGDPTEIGRYALDGARKIVFEPLPLKYLALPATSERVNLDLNVGYEHFIEYTGRNERIENLLLWISENRDKTFLAHGRMRPDFICFRGLLKYVMCTPYITRFDDWVICATKHQGTIYMVALESAAEQLRNNSLTERDHLMSYWGYKFEQYLTSDQPGGKPNTHLPVNENEEFHSVVRRQIGDHTLVFSSEVDNIDANYLERNRGSTSKSYVELKTTRQIETPYQLMTHNRYKLIKWWAQSYLPGVPTVICGYRDDTGVVRTLKTYKTEELPSIANGYWKGEVCKSFCERFLSFVKKCIPDDNPSVVYKFEWEPGKDVTCVRLTNPGVYKVLPDWYVASG